MAFGLFLGISQPSLADRARLSFRRLHQRAGSGLTEAATGGGRHLRWLVLTDVVADVTLRKCVALLQARGLCWSPALRRSRRELVARKTGFSSTLVLTQDLEH